MRTHALRSDAFLNKNCVFCTRLHGIQTYIACTPNPIYMFTQANIHPSNNYPGKRWWSRRYIYTTHLLMCRPTSKYSGHQFGQVSERHQDSCYRARADKDHCGCTHSHFVQRIKLNERQQARVMSAPITQTTGAHSHLFMPVFDSVICTHSAITTTIKRTYSNWVWWRKAFNLYMGWEALKASM